MPAHSQAPVARRRASIRDRGNGRLGAWGLSEETDENRLKRSIPFTPGQCQGRKRSPSPIAAIPDNPANRPVTILHNSRVAPSRTVSLSQS
jgi:hypothetical protein